MLVKERYYPVIEHVSGGNGVLAGVKVCKGYTAVGINNGLLINAAYTFDGAHVISVLSNEIAGMLGFNFTTGFQLFFLAFQSDYLGFCENEAIFSYTGFKGF